MNEKSTDWQQETSEILAAISTLLDQVVDETLQMQCTLGEALVSGLLPPSVLRLQGLDIHAQLQRDLASIARQLSRDVAIGRFDAHALRSACKLPSTVTCLMSDGDRLKGGTGEVQIF